MYVLLNRKKNSFTDSTPCVHTAALDKRGLSEAIGSAWDAHENEVAIGISWRYAVSLSLVVCVEVVSLSPVSYTHLTLPTIA